MRERAPDDGRREGSSDRQLQNTSKQIDQTADALPAFTFELALVYQAIDLRVKEAPQGRAVALARVAIVRAERAVAEFSWDAVAAQTADLYSALAGRPA